MQNELNETREIWSRHLSGEPLSAAAEQRLLSELSVDDSVRKQLMLDDSTHRMLLAVAPMDDDRERFTQAVMSRCETLMPSRNICHAPDPPPIETAVRSPSIDVPSITPLGPRRRRHIHERTQVSAIRYGQIAAAITLIFGAGVVTGVMTSKPNQLAESLERPDRKPKASLPSLIELESTAQPGFATLTSAAFGGWKTRRADGSRLDAGEIQLQHGEGEIAFDNGTTLHLVAPAELRLVSADQVKLDHGRVLATVPKSALGMQIVTPTSRVVDKGADFELVVSSEGATDVLVRRGNVMVEPRMNQQSRPEPILLTSTHLNRATVFKPRTEGEQQGPLATAAQGNDGHFVGVISVNGESIKFSSPQAFESVRQRVNERFRESSDRFQRDWADALGKFGSGGAAGSLHVNGSSFGFDGVDDILKLQENMLRESKRRTDAMGRGKPHFQGMINVDGEVRTFTSPEEFDKAQRETFGPLRTLGIDVFDMPGLREMFNLPRPKDEADRPDNPVVPGDKQESAQQISLPQTGMLSL